MRYNQWHKSTNFLTPTLYTQELSEYTESLTYDLLPSDVAERAKMIILHILGAAIAAKDTDVVKKSIKMACQANGGQGGDVTVWGSGIKLSAVNAALVLGTMADALRWEDCSWTGYPGASVVPCAWIAAEERHKSGKELIAAVVAGYEAYQRIAMAIQPSKKHWDANGWGSTSWQIFASVIPIAKLYGLDARKINQSLGLACESSTLSASYSETTMSDFGHYEYGYRARDGVLIAQSAEYGVHNCRDVFDEGRCYTNRICPEGNNPETGGADLSWLTRGLGKDYLILQTMLRRWPGDEWSQGVLELVADIAKAHHISAESIESIIIDPATANRMYVPEEGYISAMQAQLSMPFMVASSIIDPVPGPQWYSPDRLKDPQILSLAKRVQKGDSPELLQSDAFEALRQGSYPSKTVTVMTTTKETYTGRTGQPLGHSSHMTDWEGLRTLFCTQLSSSFTPEKANKLFDAIKALEDYDDISVLSGLLISG